MQVTHINQIHGIRCYEGDTSRRDAVNSQINVINYIRNLSSTSEDPFLVFDEGKSLKVSTKPAFYKGCREIKEAFPMGKMPKSFSNSTDEQKELIHCHGAATILYCLQDIKAMYPAESHETSLRHSRHESWYDSTASKIIDKSSAEYGFVFSIFLLAFNALCRNKINFITKHVHDIIREVFEGLGVYLPREISALEQAKYYTEKEGVDKAVIIYGEDHNFTEACNKVGVCDSLTSVSFEEPNGFMDSIWYYLGYDPIYTVVEEEMVLDTNGPIDNQNSYDQTGLDLGHEDL